MLGPQASGRIPLVVRGVGIFFVIRNKPVSIGELGPGARGGREAVLLFSFSFLAGRVLPSGMFRLSSKRPLGAGLPDVVQCHAPVEHLGRPGSKGAATTTTIRATRPAKNVLFPPTPPRPCPHRENGPIYEYEGRSPRRPYRSGPEAWAAPSHFTTLVPQAATDLVDAAPTFKGEIPTQQRTDEFHQGKSASFIDVEQAPEGGENGL